jgi:hypothetical protein
MYNFSSMREETQAHYEIRLHAAEQWRLQQRVRGDHPTLWDRVRAQLSERLIGWGEQLRAGLPRSP